jgi:hypothetical protein
VVRLYQCLVAALIEGGGAALRKYLGELGAIVAAAQQAAAQEMAEAERVRQRGNDVRYKAYVAMSEPIDMGPRGKNPPPPKWLVDNYLDKWEAGNRERANKILGEAANLERFCVLMQRVHDARLSILRAPK